MKSMQEIRLERLNTLIGDKKIAQFAREFEIDPTYISQLRNRNRTFGEKSARNFEEKIGLEYGYFDRISSETIAGISDKELLEALAAALPEMSDESKKALIKLYSEHV